MAQDANETSGMEALIHGDFCWTEIASSDAEKCKAFYSSIFGWQFKDSESMTDGFAYHEFTTPGGTYPAGGLYELTPAMCAPGQPMPPPHFMTYVAVDDVDKNAELAVELGGKVVHGPMNIPNVGRMCVIQDPSGAIFSIFNAKMQEENHG